MTDTDHALLDAYTAHPARVDDGRRMNALREASGLSPTRAYQRLVWLLTDPQAWEYAPATMGLIQRRMDRARQSRSARRAPAA